jgi:hypothetical protein
VDVVDLVDIVDVVDVHYGRAASQNRDREGADGAEPYTLLSPLRADQLCEGYFFPRARFAGTTSGL